MLRREEGERFRSALEHALGGESAGFLSMEDLCKIEDLWV